MGHEAGTMRTRIAFCAGLTLLWLSGRAEACRCAATLSPRSSYLRAHVVVVGKVQKVVGDINGAGTNTTLAVSQAWKKRVKREIGVVTNTTCAFEFIAGREYVLFLYETPGAPAYYTSKCVGNREISGARRLLAWLKQHGVMVQVD
jgi:hypothetical protein